MYESAGVAGPAGGPDVPDVPAFIVLVVARGLMRYGEAAAFKVISYDSLEMTFIQVDTALI